MKRILFLFMVLTLSLIAQEIRVLEENLAEVKFDRFTGKTVIGSSKHYLSEMVRLAYERPILVCALEYSGKIPKSKLDVTIQIVFLSFNKDWQYLERHDLYCLKDGEPFKLPAAAHKGKVMNGGVRETVLINIDFGTFRELCEAETLEFKIRLTEFILRETELDMLASIMQLFEIEAAKK